MFYLKSCFKCHGDLYSSEDMHGKYTACIQCSKYLTPAEETALFGRKRPDINSDSTDADGIDQLVSQHLGLLIHLKQQEFPVSLDKISTELGSQQKLIKGFLDNLVNGKSDSSYVMSEMYDEVKYKLGENGLEVVEAFIENDPEKDYVSQRNIRIEFIGYIDRKHRSSTKPTKSRKYNKSKK